jgi:heptosyltransferase-3
VSASRDIERILVIFPGALGDLMCVMPAIGAIAAQHRGASVELMARAELARLGVGRTVVTRGHSIDRREVTALFSDSAEEFPGAHNFFKCFERIYSFFAANHAGYRERLIAATDGVVSFHQFRPNGDGHVAAAYLDSIGEPGARLEVRVEPTAEDIGAASRAITDVGVDASKLVAIFPGSGSSTKNWPAEKFVALARMLAERFSGATVLGPAESAMIPAFRDCGIPLQNNLELGTVAGVARIASAFVGNDSGVSHLAAAVGAPAVVLFGQTDPARWRPLGRDITRVVVIRREPIDSIEPQEVATALMRISTRSVGDWSNT